MSKPMINTTTIDAFIDNLFHKYKNPIESLGIEENDLQRIHHTKFDNFPQHRFEEIEDIWLSTDYQIFEIFRKIEVVYYEEDIYYHFYAYNPSSEEIIAFVNHLTVYLGDKTFRDCEQKFSFKNHELLRHNLATHPHTNPPVYRNFWMVRSYSFILRMEWDHEDPVFVLEMPRWGPIVDHSPRENGTILDILHTDISKIMVEEEPYRKHYHEEEETLWLSYFLKERELGAFSKLTLNQKSKEPDPTFSVPTDVSFYTRRELDVTTVMELINKVVKIYSSDDFNRKWAEEDDIYAYQNIDSGFSRYWTMNDKHGLKESAGIFENEEDMEEEIYSISLSGSDVEEETNLRIMNFDKLIQYFGTT